MVFSEKGAKFYLLFFFPWLSFIALPSARTTVLRIKPATLLYAVDLAGTLLHGLEGATAAISGNLDLLGLMVLAFATALGGGIIRDLLIEYVPPSSLRDWHYSAMAFAGAALTLLLNRLGWGFQRSC